MKIKRAMCVLLVLAVLLAGLAGCGYNPAVVMTVGETDVPAGVFLYWQLIAYSEAGNKVSSELLEGLTVLDSQIDGVPAREWITARTDEMVREYVFIENEFERLDLELDAFSKMYADYTAQSSWSSDSSIYQANGISYDTLVNVIYNDFKRGILSDNLYGEGGEREILEEEIEAYFTAHYSRVDYLVFPTQKVDGTALDGEELLALVEIAEAMRATAARRGLETAFLNHYEDVLHLTGEIADPTQQEDEETRDEEAVDETEPVVVDSALFESTVSVDKLVNDRETTLPAEFYSELLAADFGAFILFTSEDGAIILYRRNAFHEEESYEDNAATIRSYLSSEPFSDYVSDSAAQLEIDPDDRARKYYSLDKVQL